MPYIIDPHPEPNSRLRRQYDHVNCQGPVHKQLRLESPFSKTLAVTEKKEL